MDKIDDQLGNAIDAMDHTTQLALEAIEQLHRAHDSDDDHAIVIDDDGYMHGDGVEVIVSERSSALPGFLHEIEAFVWHFTDTRNAGAANLARRIAKRGKARSCHVWIDGKGSIAQSVSFKRGSWHAGSSTARTFSRMTDRTWRIPAKGIRGTHAPNYFAAGIELECVGEVKRITDRRAGKPSVPVWAGWPFRFDYVPPGETRPELPTIVPDEEVIQNVDGKCWHFYTPAQIVAAERVTRAAATHYHIPRENFAWGHSQVDPSRRTDPGPLWLGDAWNDHTKLLGGHLAVILQNIYGDGSRL